MKDLVGTCGCVYRHGAGMIELCETAYHLYRVPADEEGMGVTYLDHITKAVEMRFDYHPQPPSLKGWADYLGVTESGLRAGTVTFTARDADISILLRWDEGILRVFPATSKNMYLAMGEKDDAS